MVKNKVYLGLGTNLGEKLANLKQALNVLSQRCGEIVKLSSVYESEPWGFDSQDNFYNMVILLETRLEPFPLLKVIKGLESELGRKPKVGDQYESRLIDLDILFFNDINIDEEGLTIPHPHIKNRSFVYLPLLEILDKNTPYYNELKSIPNKENLKKINKSELL